MEKRLAMDESENTVREDQSPLLQRDRLPQTLTIVETISNEHACSYLSDKTANLPLILPARRLTLDEFDCALENGLRRSGVFLYYTACGECTECKPSRVDVSTFNLSRSMQRVLKRGDEKIEIKVSTPVVDEERLNLFNLHRLQRGLGEADHLYRIDDYEGFLVDSCCGQTIELSFWYEETLIAISIVDCGRLSLSAVYTYFDPGYSKLSLGTYSILKQMQYATSTHRRYVYLGMYVEKNRHLSYKARFAPQERWIEGRWESFPEPYG